MRTSILLLVISPLCFGIPSTPDRHPFGVQERANMQFQKSELYGEPHGKRFDDTSSLPSKPKLLSLTLRGANRLDGISFGLTSGKTISHGGTGGKSHSITLDPYEAVTSIKVCWGRRNERTRIFYVNASTGRGRNLEAGTLTKYCHTAVAPNDWAVVGAFGRDGAEVDQLGHVRNVGVIIAMSVARDAWWDLLARTFDLGFTAFGGPPVHFQILHRRFVDGNGKAPWLDEQTVSAPDKKLNSRQYQELFSICQALPGPASTKMTFCIAFMHAGFVAAVVVFLVWSLPGAVGMYGLALGVDKIGVVLPGPVYALLSGLNSSTVGIIALAAVQLARKAITDEVTRVVVLVSACAGLCYNALWYFPVIMVVGGSVVLVWDHWVRGRVGRWMARRRREQVEAIPMETIPAPVKSDASPERAPVPLQHKVPLKLGILIIVGFFGMFTAFMVVRGVVEAQPLPLELFINMLLAGTIIFGGGPVVIPLLREYVVEPGWVAPRDFLIGLAIIQAFPGPNFNFAVYLGALALRSSKTHTVVGAVLGYVGIFLPGLVLAMGFQSVWRAVRSNRFVGSMLRGVNAAAVGLVFTAVHRLWEIGYVRADATRGVSLGLEPWWVVIAGCAYVGVESFGVPTALAIVGGGAMGLVRTHSALPPPVSPFRPNLDALKLDVSDDEEEVPPMEKIWTREPSDSDSSRPSPRPRATTLAQNTVNRPFVRTASQPVDPNLKRLMPKSRPLSEITPAATRKPLVSASGAKFLARSGRISPPRRVLVKDQEAETEDEVKPYPVAALRRKEGTPEPGRLMSSPDARESLSPTDSPIEHPPSPPPQPHPLATSSAAAKTSTSSLASTASSLRGGVKARLQDWKSSIGSWSKSARSRLPTRPSLEGILMNGDSRPSTDSLHDHVDRPSFDTVRPNLDPPDPMYESEGPDPPRPPRAYEPRSASSAGWHEKDRPGTSAGYYAAQVKSVQQHDLVRRPSDSLRASPSPLDTPPSRSPLSSLRHKRSPTAPSPPTSTVLAARFEKENRVGQTWAAGQDPILQERADAAGVAGSYGADVGGYAGMGREEGKALERERERLREVENRGRVADLREKELERERERERDRERDRDRDVRTPGTASTTSTLGPKREKFPCNKQEYSVVDLIGRGGSSKVYKVISPNNKILAMKRVRLDSKVDEETLRGYINEMQLLKRLEGNERIIKLIDSQAAGRGARYLVMVMELGEIDLAKLLQERLGQLLQPHWIAIYWQQMLEAVQTIHEEKIVHSDLKPANFVLVKGSLKLIDFGIAKAIANDTTNIQREHQVGTLNYMSPESIEETQTANGRRLKLGRASDVWSLGCILYQMIYGRPPFYSITGAVQKLRAISDPNHVIEFPAVSVPVAPAPDKDGQPRQLVELATPIPPDVIETLRGCLTRDPKQRRTIPELLEDPWLRSWRHTATQPAAPVEAPKLKDGEAIVNEAWLKQIIEFASREVSENGALDAEGVSQMAQVI
ncbi:Serine/Threonine-kinase TTK/MPS1 [Ceratobasidium theobromae]|uniref:Serine/Threonine-kinase TTK/MPS1 n=1 Tax=Ceratobasidium theobromae TaxID=1582974 RepID=A0A5N5QCS8_9AGAM|nr:Serine/Threonine-kinase TTK/MPS1 [Ceratobasidium theobromae]